MALEHQVEEGLLVALEHLEVVGVEVVEEELQKMIQLQKNLKLLAVEEEAGAEEELLMTLRQ